MKNLSLKKVKPFLAGFILLLSLSVIGQTERISGIVSDSSIGPPVPGAIVFLPVHNEAADKDSAPKMILDPAVIQLEEVVASQIRNPSENMSVISGIDKL